MIGRTIRQYLVTDRIGQGGMGEVWKARDTILDRDVALKVLPAHDADAAARKERFFREARAASALNHPNIITIYEINSDQGIDFIAMEFVRGRTLAALLRTGPLPIEQVLRYASQMTEAVGRAHSAGIVHRDLKPGNIMVTDQDDLVKVLDFGIAKVGGPTSDASEPPSDLPTRMALTRAGSSIGTVGYMSPEQAIGDVVDARSDVFSVGVILYEMLAGQRPFVAETSLDVLHALHFSDPPPLASVRPDTPPAIAAIVSHALAKKPADRYANLSQMASAIRMAVSGDTVASASAGSATAAFLPARRMTWRRAVVIGLAAAAMAGAAGVAVWRTRGPSVQAKSAIAAPAVNESADPYVLTRDAAALLARPDKEGNVDRAVVLLERALTLEKDSALALAHLSAAYLRRYQTNPDAQWLKLARETAQRAMSLNPDLAASRQAMGFVQLEAGERTEAAAEFRRAADLDPVNPFPHVGLALIFAAQNQDAEADAAFRRAIELGSQAWRPHNEYGQFFFRRARYGEAAEQWEMAQKLTPDNVLVLRNLGAVYYLMDRHDEAASILQRALEVRPSAATYTNLGTIRFFQGRYTDAVAAFEKAVELGANNQQFWGNLGDGYRWAPGRRADALAAYRHASELIQQQIEKTPEDADLRSRRALYLIKMGDRIAALKEIQGLADRTTLNAQMLYRLTVVYELSGDRSRALNTLERALKAGYSQKDLNNEPELIGMRADARYHRLIDVVANKPRPQ